MLMIGTHVNYWLELLPGILIFGLGLSITVAPLTAAILGAVPQEHAGIGSAINNAIARIAGLIAVACAGLIVAGPLSQAGLRRVLLVCMILLVVGGIVSAIGIQNKKTTGTDAEGLARPVPPTAAPTPTGALATPDRTENQTPITPKSRGQQQPER